MKPCVVVQQRREDQATIGALEGVAMLWAMPGTEKRLVKG